MPPRERSLPTVGDVLADRYELSEVISRGSFGLVFAARQTDPDRLVSVKILMPHVLANEDAVRRFEREAELAGRLRHPNTIRILDFGQTSDGLPFCVMEHVPGQTLRQVLRQEGCLSPARTRDIGIQVLRSLAEAHAKGIVHRDLKPENLLLCRDPNAGESVKVVDFGVAKATGSDSERPTGSGVVIGTPPYMSPEQARGDRDVDGRSDLYTVGLILAECLTGRRALGNATFAQAAGPDSESQPTETDPHVGDHSLLPVITRATEQSRTRRYQTAEAMCADLEALQGLSSDVLPGIQPLSECEPEDTPITLPDT